MNPRYQATRFVTAAHNLGQLPPDEGAEVAFAGRSNAGKSSALNLVTSQRTLARVSKTPGRTQQINYFEVVPGQCLVDLPGYGYAKVGQRLREHWQRTLGAYLAGRGALRGLVLLMDVRHPLTDLDVQMLEWCQQRLLPVQVLLTKSDKLSRSQAQATLLRVRKALQPLLPDAGVQLFSALDRVGVDEVHACLDRWLQPMSAEG